MNAVLEPRGLHLQALETPGYVFDPAVLLEDYRDLKRALGTTLFLSFKANPCPDLLARCVHEIDGIELASLGELDVVVTHGRLRKFMNGPALDATTLRAALASRATVTLDNPLQAETLLGSMKGPAPRPPLLRVNAGALLGAPRGNRDHFGMDPETVVELARRLVSSGVGVGGLHVFIGSRLFHKAAANLPQALGRLVTRVERETGATLPLLNLGGGFPEDWRSHSEAIAAYAASLQDLAGPRELAHEAGRAVFARCGAFITRVVAVKHIEGTPFIICDGGLAQNFLLSIACAPFGKPAAPRVLRQQEAGATLATPVRIFGPSCNQQDCIGELPADTPLPAVGDLLRFDRCGAYCRTYTMTHFLNSRQASVYLHG